MTHSGAFSFDRASEALARIKATKSVREFERVFLDVVSEIGYRYFVISGIPGNGENLADLLVVAHVPDAWRNIYFASNYIEIDPVARRCAVAPEPFFWTEVITELERDSPEHALMRRAEEHGLINGVCFPVHGVNGLEAGVSLSGKSGALNPSDMRNLHLFSLYAFNRLKSIARGSAISVPSLTKREREILLWSAFGKTNRQVADILFLSEETVATHMKNIIKKLSAQNKAEAIAVALRAGLIPG